MSAYCFRADVTDLLPAGHGLSTTQLDGCIARGSGEAEDKLARWYWTPFTSVTEGQAHPSALPYQIRYAVQYLATAHALYLLMVTNSLDQDGQIGVARAMGNQLLGPLIDGTEELAPISFSETLNPQSAWGDGDPLGTDEVPLSASARSEVIPASAAITNFENGIDYLIYFHDHTRQWVFRRIDSSIGTGQGHTLTYDANYVKKRERSELKARVTKLRRA